jgi:RNA polymerase sigma factor (sigma-70 family)
VIDPADHIGLAHVLAQRYVTVSRRHLADDIHAAALCGVVLAARTYDPAVGDEFSTHAGWKVRGEVMLLLRAETPKGFRHHLCDRAKAPRTGYLDAADDGIPSGVFGVEGGAGRLVRPHPLEDRRGCDQAAVEAADAFDSLVGRCRPRVAEVLRLYYRDGLADPEIGRRLGLSQQRAQRLRAEGLGRLREGLSA